MNLNFFFMTLIIINAIFFCFNSGYVNCYIYDDNYSIVCFSYTNANDESIAYKGCLSKYGDGYYCCGTCKNRTCCNDTSQFLVQIDCGYK